MKRIIFTIVFAISLNAVFAQTYNMKIKQGTVTVYSQTSTIDNITFDNTTNFTCGNPVLYGGKTYQTILIGSQCWFQENLDVGTMIQGSQDQTNNGLIEKYCYNNLDANCVTYGGLYQWDETMQYSTTPGVQGICPPGWHIPTYTEFTTLITVVSNDGNKLKAIGQGTVNGAGTNTSGFSALLAGRRNYNNGGFSYLGDPAYFWSTMEISSNYASSLYLNNSTSNVYLSTDFKTNGFSVRCLKD